MSFGPMFTLRPRARQARPDAAREAFPSIAGWFERRSQLQAEPGPGTPKRRAADRRDREGGPK
ncbi:hypothetical protein [Ramlibacter algicola]|uniref:Uncharacterized protein n=1 Tax=Ramlibacter algicola TaxID=2795217 RepID=A0A934PZK7_9BURK|nr:hypothetical protein [Ramlibacter algicola]MBK0392445.1 hypothetical protein [Ramlibacter algicola]